MTLVSEGTFIRPPDASDSKSLYVTSPNLIPVLIWTFTLLSLPLNFFRYNNKTYRIDDIAWDHTPSNTFKRGDTDISFKDYYKTVGVMHSTQVLL